MNNEEGTPTAMTNHSGKSKKGHTNMTPTAIANYSGKNQQKSMSLNVHTPLEERIPKEVDHSTYVKPPWAVAIQGSVIRYRVVPLHAQSSKQDTHCTHST